MVGTHSPLVTEAPSPLPVTLSTFDANSTRAMLDVRGNYPRNPHADRLREVHSAKISRGPKFARLYTQSLPPSPYKVVSGAELIPAQTLDAAIETAFAEVG